LRITDIFGGTDRSPAAVSAYKRDKSFRHFDEVVDGSQPTDCHSDDLTKADQGAL